jgi:hypothetical protein
MIEATPTDRPIAHGASRKDGPFVRQQVAGQGRQRQHQGQHARRVAARGQAAAHAGREDEEGAGAGIVRRPQHPEQQAARMHRTALRPPSRS